MQRKSLLMNMYGAMLDKLGPSHWWPGETPFEIAVGAILTQNTNWSNVAKAIANLKHAGVMDAATMYALSLEELAEMIRPAGYYRLKSKRLHHFLAFLRSSCRFNMDLLRSRDMDQLRSALLGVHGIGPETADSILLYALEQPTFVVDAYTARICHRHGLVPEEISHEELRAFFMDVLTPDIRLFNEFHALLVRVGKDWCKKSKPLCASCPLGPFLEGTS
ncbi:endonuclease III domain-containing protein [Desulfoplanes formicivorans]|uniref:Endonuclease n=1 Tax=Desulfoplanes formicivorans TaxID=1592317 RepID=A0A194AKU0_9BACT|nr:endonuclease [Desulfoplanes formicivorans]GAU09933.1 endonuclease [Desulfoplanes formicivorans]